MKEYNEELLSAWLRVSNAICNERIVSSLSYNESLVCNIIYNQMKHDPENYLTATDLCEKTRLIKSLMSRTINGLVKKKILVKERSGTDKRNVYVKLNKEAIPLYEKSREGVLAIVEDIRKKLEERLGKEKSVELVDTLNTIADVASEVVKDIWLNF